MGDSMGIKIPPHFLSDAHLASDMDLFFEVTDRGLLLTTENIKKSIRITQAIANIKSFRNKYGTFSATEIKTMLDEGRT
jgi:antitoxin component of MazEF toxin-antitoxin module